MALAVALRELEIRPPDDVQRQEYSNSAAQPRPHATAKVLLAGDMALGGVSGSLPVAVGHSLPFVSLFTQRRAAREEAAARARGETVDGLSDEAPSEFRQQLVYAINRAASWPVGPDYEVRNLHRYLIQEIRQYLREEYGVARLAAATDDPGVDLAVFIENSASTPQVMDVIDAVIHVFAEQMTTPALHDYAVNAASNFAATISKRMKQHKLSYDLVEFKVVEKRSEELHTQAVAPALTLLHGRSRFTDAERQYRDALNELADGNWADAITDASAAVENVLRTILGLSQGTLADLLGQARIRGLFGNPQAARLRKVVTGFTALADMRNEESDAHGNSSDSATGWLALHWAGALIVYLVQRAESLGL
jgi:hypothetical protein